MATSNPDDPRIAVISVSAVDTRNPCFPIGESNLLVPQGADATGSGRVPPGIYLCVSDSWDRQAVRTTAFAGYALNMYEYLVVDILVLPEGRLERHPWRQTVATYTLVGSDNMAHTRCRIIEILSLARTPVRH